MIWKNTANSKILRCSNFLIKIFYILIRKEKSVSPFDIPELVIWWKV